MNNQQPPPSGRRKRRKQRRYYLPNNHYYRQQPPPNPNSTEKIDEAVVTAPRVVIGGGEHVTFGWLDSLGAQFRHVPSLNRLISLEHKINGYISCFVEVWKITTLYDLETQICKSEGVRKFEELELGPLIRHPLIVHYFSVKSDSARAFKISGQEVISFLVEFMDTNKCIEVKDDELLDFIAKKRSVDSKEKLHVRIQNLGLYSRMLQVRSLENSLHKKCLSDVGNKIMELPVLMSQKTPLEENFSALSEHIKPFSEDNNEDIESNHEDETCLPSQSKNSSQDMKSSEQFIGSLSPDNILVKKRKSDAIDCSAFLSHNIFIRDGVGQSSRGTKISTRPPSMSAVTTKNNQQPPLPRYYLPNNHYYSQQPPPNPSLNSQNQSLLLSSNSSVLGTEKINEAVVTARCVLVAGGEHVSSWKVSRAALGGLDSFGVDMRHVPSLNRLITLKHKINGYINCFVDVWKITTLYDLETQICKSEGVRKFEELELGPLIRLPLIVHYFSVKSDSARAFKISGQEVISSLINFMDTNYRIEVKGDELLDFIAEKRSVDSKEKLHVRIQSLGLYIDWILQARSMENAKYKSCLSNVGSKSMELPVLMSREKPLEENISAVSEHIKLFSKDINGNDIESNHEDETCLPSQSKNSSQDMKSSEHFIGSPSRDNILAKKRKSDAIDCTAFQSHKIFKRDGAGQSSPCTKSSNNILREEPVTASEDTLQNSKQQEESVTASEDIVVTLKTEHASPILFKKCSVTDKPSLKASMSHHLLDASVAQASHDLSGTENFTIQNVEKRLPLKLDKDCSSKALKEKPTKVILKEEEATHMNFGILSDRNTGFSAFTVPDRVNATWASLSNKDQQNSATKVNESELLTNGDPIIEQKPASKTPSVIFGIVNTGLSPLTRNDRPGFSAFTRYNGPGFSAFTSSDRPNATSFNLINRDSKRAKDTESPSNGDRIIEQNLALKVPSFKDVVETNKTSPDSESVNSISETHRSSKEIPTKMILKEEEATKDRSDTGTHMNFGFKSQLCCGGPNPAGQSSGGMGFNTNNTQSNFFSSSSSFTQPAANPFYSATSTNPFAQKNSAFSIPAFASSIPTLNSSPFQTPTNFFATTQAQTTPSLFSSTSTPFGTPNTSLFGTTQAQGTTPSSFGTGMNFGTQLANLFQSSSPALNQTSSPFGQTGSAFGQTGSAFGQTGTAFGQSAPAFGQPNAFSGNMFSSTPVSSLFHGIVNTGLSPLTRNDRCEFSAFTGHNGPGFSASSRSDMPNKTQSNLFSSSPSFTQPAANPFPSTTSTNPFAQNNSALSTPAFASSTPTRNSSPFQTPTNPFATTQAQTTLSLFSSTSNPFGTPNTSLFGTTQAQGTTPSSFGTGMNFGTQLANLFQSSSPVLNQTSSPFGQTGSAFGPSAPAFGQPNAFSGNMFSSTPSLQNTSNLGFNQAPVSSLCHGIVNTGLSPLTRNDRPEFSAFTGHNGPGFSASTRSDMPNATSFNLINTDKQIGSKKAKYSEPPSNGGRIIEQNSASKVPSLILEEDVGLKDIPESGICRDVFVMDVGLKSQLDYGKNVFSSDMNAGISAITGGTKASSSEKDQLSWGTITPQQVITRSAAELLASKSAKLGEKSVSCDTVAEGKDDSNEEVSAKKIIELIRREKFGLNPDTSTKEDNTLKEQHAMLGRSLQLLSQELYSQDSHYLLELVQNADDNVYPCDVEPTLNFILQEAGVVVLNNEQGFSAENIKALCDVGKSTKKEPGAGYIGKKGIGFKSVFRVTDAPEIHSNGFHIKFDVSDGQIGFVLPTNIPPCRIDSFSKLVSLDTDPMYSKHWNTCIILPFRSKKNEAFSAENLDSMFSNLHPSLLLFLHRLKCIKFRNLLNDSLTVMRKEVIGDGIVNVSTGKEKMAWFVKSQKFKASHKRPDVQTTEISVAFMLEDLNNGNYISKLDQQPVFAFLPVRNYGLKFIIQADFTLPTSREEVDGNNPWNKWLLAQFPNLFVSAERSLCNLSCFRKNLAKGVSIFMSFVPLRGEVNGFFSQLPDQILFLLLKSDCLLLEGDGNVWVPPSKVLRNWTEEIRSLLPDSLIKKHLGLGYLNKDIVLTDSLARTLGIKDCGPTILIQLMTSLCHTGSLKSMGLKWLSSWINALYLMTGNGNQSHVIRSLCQVPFIPLMDGSYASIQKGTIWLHTDPDHRLEAFKKLYLRLRIVNHALFSDSHVENISQLLYKVGVQRLSAHDILKRNILPLVFDKNFVKKNKELMIECLSFIMLHLETTCSECVVQKEHILSQLRNSAFISTNHGFKRLVDVPIHFSEDFGNPIDMSKLVVGTNMQWFEIDNSYLEHPVFKLLPDRTLKWRKFLLELGVTDFVKIVKVEKRIKDISDTVLEKMMLDDGCISSGSKVKDWDSQELSHLLLHVSSNHDREKVKYLLEVLDTLWDDYFSDKLTGFCIIKGLRKPFKASIIRILNGVRWLDSSIDDQLHFPKDLFRNCESVHAVLGDNAPYCIPKVNNLKLLNDIGIKGTVNLDDALSVLEVWRRSEKPFRASISQMLKLYTFIWNEMSISRQKIMECLHSQAFIFVPYSFNSTLEVVSGLFLSPSEVYWNDSIFSSMEQTKLVHPQFDQNITHCSSSKMLCNVYPGLHYFFVTEFGVAENPPLLSYLQSLQDLSARSSPSQAAKTVFQVFKKWCVGLDCGFISSDDIDYLKKSMEEKEMKILPTVKDKWVSLHESFGLICWCDDDQLRKEFINANNIDFLCLGDCNNEEKQLLQDKVSVLFRRLGIPSLSEVVTREAIYYDLADNSHETSLVSWALPYAQRYIFSLHRTEYSELKLSGFDNLHSLQIVVVEKLLYKNVIKKCGIESNNLCECSCLLQDNVLYATHKSDSHPLFMELSHLLLAGIHELHLANFLYMITTMAKSGFTEEKMEFFITNSQKLPTLPSEESQWSLASTSSPEEGLNPGKPLSWPPVDWKPAPRFEDVSKTKDVTAGISWDVTEGLYESGDDWIIEESPALTTTTMILEEDESLKDQSESVINGDIISSDMDVGSRDQLHYGKSIHSSDMHAGSSTIITYEGPALTTTSVILEEDESSENQPESGINKDVVSSDTDVCFRDQPLRGMNIQSHYMNSAPSAIIRYNGKDTFSPQQVTGRTGERVAFKYFSEKLGDRIVKWVNEDKETGLPYDIVVEGKDDDSKEYIEVKSTSYERKDWFGISVREWQFAVEKGDSFSIARVVLSHGKLAQIATYRNPVELCQSKQLHLQMSLR